MRTESKVTAAHQGRCTIRKIFANWQWILVIVLFLLGLSQRLAVFNGPHDEGDEFIYGALVEQLEKGNGYTLQGTPLLEYGLVDKEQYGKKLFFHPPGGIGLFWLSSRLLGPKGLPFVQVFSYALFFWSMVFLTHLLGLSSSKIGLFIAAGLCAFNPIMAHVSTHYWLDGPLLGFSALSAAIFIWAVMRKNLIWACMAGVILGYASLIKITAFLAAPGLIILSWPLLEKPRANAFLGLAACLVMPALIVQLPWEIWQWIEFGTPFPGWAGKPSKSLIESNRYVHYLTVVRSPWIYLTMLPRIAWTIVPAAVLYVFTSGNKTVRWLGLALLVWIFTVLSFHIILGFQGYSKVIRYVILIVPPAVLLFSMVFSEAVRRFGADETGAVGKAAYAFLIIVSALAFIMEIAAGIKSSILYGNDLIVPLLGGF